MKTLLKRIFAPIRKITIVLVVFYVIFQLFYVFIFGLNDTSPQQENVYQEPIYRTQIYEFLNDPELEKTEHGRMTKSFHKATMCALIGEACTDNPADGDKYLEESFAYKLAEFVTFPYANPPASGVYWAYNGLENAGFTPSVYAQSGGGVGFHSLSAFIPIWDAFRSVAYIVIVVAVVVLGFLIMFRVKLDGQTVVAVENAIPRFIITLLLISFSFAIVGFLVDLAYLLMILAIEIVTSSGLPGFSSFGVVADLRARYLSGNLFFVLDHLQVYAFAVQGLLDIFPQAIAGLIKWAISTAVVMFAGQILQWIYNYLINLLGDFTVDVSVGIGGSFALMRTLLSIGIAGILLHLTPILYLLFFYIIATIGIMAIILNIFFLILGSYIRIIIQLIFAPLILLPNVIPGNNSFETWFRKILGNILVFPLIVGFFLISEVIFIQGVDPNARSFSIPLTATLNTQHIPYIISGVILVMTPHYVKSIIKPILGEEKFGGNASSLLLGAAVGGAGSFAAMSQFATIANITDERNPIGRMFQGFFGRKGQKGRGVGERQTPIASAQEAAQQAQQNNQGA